MKLLAGLPGPHRFTATRHSNIALLARTAASPAAAPAAAPPAPAPAAALATLAAIASLTRARTVHARATVTIRPRESGAVATRILPGGTRAGLCLIGNGLDARRLLATVLVTVPVIYSLALLAAIARTLIAALATALPISAVPVAIPISALTVSTLAISTVTVPAITPFAALASLTPITTMP